MDVDTAAVSSVPPVRYIKLGRGGRWAARALAEGELHLGHKAVPHDLALKGSRDALIQFFLERGHKPGKASDFAREVMDFYQLGPDAIWITFHDGRLWWAQAQPEVEWLGETDDHGARIRRTLEPWRNADRKGTVLRQDSLSTKLTKVTAYQQTLCKVEAADYLLRRLAGDEEPLVTEALSARKHLMSSATALIAALHWADFETLVDVILARSGWHRSSALGGTMKDADLLVEQTVTGETALVQVKSSASQAVLDDYIDRFEANPTLSRLIFVCHSPRGTLAAPNRPAVAVWAREALAEMAIRNGLFDWLIARAS